MVIRLRPHYWLPVSRLCLAVACLGILQTKNAPGAEEFRLVKRAVKIAERGEVIGYTLLVESNKFSFLPPLNWQVRGSPSEKQVVFLPRDLIASISLKVLPTQVATNAGLHPDQVRQLALDRYPDAKVRGQFTCVVNGGPGEAIDLERVGGNETLVLTRLARISSRSNSASRTGSRKSCCRARGGSRSPSSPRLCLPRWTRADSAHRGEALVCRS